MENKSLRNLVLTALFIAIVFLATYIKVPIPVTGGYLNLGDGVIYTVAALFGWPMAMIAGAFGSSLCDVVSGFSQWALFTFFIKGMMGFVAGYFASKNNPLSLKNFLGIFFAILILIGGYYLAGAILLGSYIVALKEIPLNILQSIFAIAIYIPLVSVVKKSLKNLY